MSSLGDHTSEIIKLRRYSDRCNLRYNTLHSKLKHLIISFANQLNFFQNLEHVTIREDCIRDAIVATTNVTIIVDVCLM